MGKDRKKKVVSGKRIFRKSKDDKKLISESTTDNEKLEDIEKVTEDLAKKDGEHEAPKTSQEALERLKKTIAENEEYCISVVSDQNKLDSRVSKFNEDIQAIAAKFHATSKAWDSEKTRLLTQIAEARKESEEMSIKNERALAHYNAEMAEFESGLDESQASGPELLQKIAENRYQWDSEKENLESKVAVLQTRLESLATERDLLNHQNRELRTEVESLKVQLKESNATAAQLEDQVSSLAAAKMFLEKENKSLQSEMERRALVSEEREVIHKRKVGELETALDSVKKDLDSSMVIITEKERNLSDLQHKHSESAEIRKSLEQKSSSLPRDINKRTKVLEENDRLQLKIRELETSLHSLSMDLQAKDAELQDLKARLPPFPAKSQTPTPKYHKSWKSYFFGGARRIIVFIANVILR